MIKKFLCGLFGGHTYNWESDDVYYEARWTLIARVDFAAIRKK